MKRYKDYMDSLETSDTLHQRLVELETPQKRPAAWKKYGVAAAALILAAGVGAGAWGLSRGQSGWGELMDHFDPAGQWASPEMADDFNWPDIVLEDPNGVTEPGMKTNGGYEVVHGDKNDPNTMVSYYFLPYIEYGMAKNVSEMALDWDLPRGSTQRNLTLADIAALFGGEKTLSDHLAWGGYELSGWAAWQEDGSLWGAFLYGNKGDWDRFELAFVTGDRYPPTCILYGDGVTNEVWDLSVTAWEYDGPNGYDYRVEFLNDGCGCRFDLTATDRQTEILVSRLVRWIATEGLALDALTSDGAVPAHPWEAEPGYSVGEPNWADGETGEFVPGYDPAYEDGVPDEDSDAGGFYCDCPECINGTVHTHPYDPSADIVETTPPYSASN